MRLSLLIISLVASLGFALNGFAKDVGIKPEELLGEWTITGDSLGDAKHTIIFGEEGKTTIKVVAGSSSSSASGPTWSYTEGRLSFEGSAKVADLKVTGTWVTDWNGPDEILITIARGNQFTMKRVMPKK